MKKKESKKQYNKPQMKIIKLKHRSNLLWGSDVKGYGDELQ